MNASQTDEKVLATIQIDKDLHHWLEQLAVVEEGQRFNLSAQVNQILRAAKDSDKSFDTPKAKKLQQELQAEQLKMLKTILQTSVESLMIARNQFLSEPEAQAKLTQSVREMLGKQFEKLSDDELIKECL